MSSRKRKSAATIDSDEDQPSKKGKTTFDKPTRQVDDDGNPYWEISSKKRITVSDWKGATLLNIREYYQKDGKTLPGKGIALTGEQVIAMVEALPAVLQALREKGIEVHELGGAEGGGDDQAEGDDERVTKDENGAETQLKRKDEEDEEEDGDA